MSAVIAVDLGGTNTRVAWCRQPGTIARKRSASTPKEGSDPAAIARFIAGMIRAVAGPEEIASAAGIGVATAGPVSLETGTVVNPPNLPFRGIPIAAPLEKEFGLPVRLANDCHAGAIGEAYFGAGRLCRNFVYITISTGIGAGIVANGRLLIGRDGNAGEIGHFTVDTTYNATCGCGFSGHWEGYAAGRYIPRFFGLWARSSGTVPDVEWCRSAEGIFAAARAGEPLANLFLKDLGRINARGISDVTVAYDPGVIILDGSVVRGNEDLVIPPILENADRFLPLPEIRVSPLGGDAPLLGASVIADGYVTAVGSLVP